MKKNHIINYSNYHGIEFKKDSVPFFYDFHGTKRRIYIISNFFIHERMVDYMNNTNCIEPVDTLLKDVVFQISARLNLNYCLTQCATNVVISILRRFYLWYDELINYITKTSLWANYRSMYMY